MNLNQRDQKIIWHPYLEEKNQTLPIPIKSARGAYLYGEDGKEYLDLISSWWVNLHGHAHPEIAQAIYEQACNLEHVIFAGFTHEPAVKLCEELQQLLPSHLSRFFFSDNGSTSVEIALKMAYQYWFNLGEKQKTIFLCFNGGYHGDTFGAMSVSVSSGFHDAFSKLFFSVLTVPFPETWLDDEQVDQKEKQALEKLEKYLEDYSQQIAAMILEPLVQGAAGMKICRPQFIEKLMETLKAHNILVIFDEVMTGFGRTGTLFALDQINVKPDFICLSKGLTGGFLPLALTITSEKIYEAFLNEHFCAYFGHGHTYMANPLGCAAALTSLKLLLKSSTTEARNYINKIHHEGIAYLLKKCPKVKKTRIIGVIAAFELDSNKDNLQEALRDKFLENGLVIRPLNNIIYLLPPYCIAKEELIEAYEKIAEIMNGIDLS